MNARASRGTALFAGVLIAFSLLTACSAAAPQSSEDSPAPTAAGPSPTVDQSAVEMPTGEMFDCSEAVVAYARTYGYPEATPVDPVTLEIPMVQFDTRPDCYLTDESSGTLRRAAFWQNDPQGVLTSLGSSLGAAGYVQSADYGPLVWWVNGEDPTTAEHAISAAPQEVDGVEMLWATW